MPTISQNWLTRIALTFALAAVAISAHSQVYKCKDSAGKTVYSGAPCEYGSKPLPLSDNTVQGERPRPDAYGTSSNYAGTSDVSAECTQAQRALQDQTGKPPPRGIAEANRQRQYINQLSKQVEVACSGGNTGASPGPMNQASAAPVDQARCEQLRNEMGKLATKEPSPGMAAGYRERSQFNMLSDEYEIVCLGIAPDRKKKTARHDEDEVSRCYDGSYVAGSDGCHRCPDGTYVPRESTCALAPNGRNVAGDKDIHRCPDGSYVGGTCTLGPNGKYYGK